MKKLLAFMLCLCMMLTVVAGGVRNTARADLIWEPAEIVEIDPEPEEEPVAEPAPKPEEEPVAEPVPEPAEEPVVEPVPEPAEEPAVEPAPEPAEEPVEEPAEEPVVESAPEPAEEPVEEPVPEPEEAEEPAAEEEPAAPEINIGLGGTGYETYAPDTVVGTVNGSEVTWVEYYYWLYNYVMISQQAAQLFGMGVESWDSQELYMAYYMAVMYGYLSLNLPEFGLNEDSTNAEIVTAIAKAGIVQTHAVETGLKEIGVTLSEEDEAELQAYIEDCADQLEGSGDGDGVATEEEIAAFAEYLETEGGYTLDFFKYMNEIAVLENNGFLSLYGTAGADLDEEEAVSFAAENDILSAKHILLLTKDPATGEDLPEEEVAEKRAVAEELLEKLLAEEDQEARIALFDELTAEYTEDSGYISYPDGYVFMKGEMVQEFEDAVRGLDENYGLSDIVESSYGYHIILRTPVDPDGVLISYGATLRNVAAAELFYRMEQEWIDNAEAEWNEGFESPDLAAIFG